MSDLDVDDDILKRLGPAMIKALGGVESVAGLVAGLMARANSDQTQVKLLTLVFQCMKASEAVSDDPLEEMSAEELDAEIAKYRKASGAQGSGGE